jgi:NCS1 family nucleobase:cation symporter-1
MDNMKSTVVNSSIDLDGLNPIPFSHRTMSPMSYAMVFWSSTIIVQIMVIGLYLMPPHGTLNFIQTLVVGIVSGVIVSVMMVLNGDAGARYGIPYVIQARASFGVQGAKLTGIIRSIPAICWNGVCTWIGANALEVVTTRIFGWSHLWSYFIGLLILQAVLSYIGFKSIKWFDATMSIIIFIMLFYFFYVVFATGKVDFSKAMQNVGSWGLAFWAGVMGATANYTTVLLNSSDLIRHIDFKTERLIKGKNYFANMFGVIPPWMFMFFAGIIISLATGAQDPIDGLVTLAPSPAFGVLLLCFVILAQVTSNLTLNILPPALAFQEVFKIDWHKGIIVTTILSVLVCPWVLFTSEYFFVFQNIYSSFLGPILGVMISDYYFLRKKQLHIDALYEGSKYQYVNGYSVLALISMVCGAIVSFIFLSYSWLIGFPFTLILYTILKKTCGAERKFEAEQGLRIE